MALGNVFGGGVVLAAASVGLITVGTSGSPVQILHLSIQQLAIVSVFAALGAIARVFMDGAEARNKAAREGVKPEDRPQVDFVALGYAIIGAPFVGSVAYTAVQWTGFVPDQAAACVVMGMGYLGRDAINAIISRFQRLVIGKIGDISNK